MTPNNPLYNLLHFFFLLSLCFAAAFSDLAADQAALLSLRAALRGRTLLWNTTAPTPCFWKGVTCANVTGNPRVTALQLPGAGLQGVIQANIIGKLNRLEKLSLRKNSLLGPIPPDLGSCTELRDLSLQNNNFSGEIPATLLRLTKLVRVNLGQNNLSGEIPEGFGDLTLLKTLFLENNQFTGSIPDHLNRLSELKDFNVSYNRLNGSIPERLQAFHSQSFQGTFLCGGPLGSCPCNGENRNVSCPSNGESRKLSGGAIAGIISGSAILLVLILVICLVFQRRNKAGRVSKPEHEFPRPSQHPTDNRLRKTADGLVFFENEYNELFTLEDLLRASAQVLGKGMIGTTYRACLETGDEVTVKRLKSAHVHEEEFREKMEKLGCLVHDNLVPFTGYFYGRDEKLLVYKFMDKGSLCALLHGNKRENLTWEFKYRIAYGVACGLEYIHAIGPNYTHGNIKSSNILFTHDYQACISEFGLIQLVSSKSSSMLSYRAPELAYSQKTTHKADIYSFGIVLLELITGKSPDEEEGAELLSWARSVDQEKSKVKVFEPQLFRHVESYDDQVVRLLRLAVACTALHPDRRPSIIEIKKCIEELQR